MKNQLVVVLLGLVFALQAHAQQTNSKPEVFKIGTQTIVVPAPDGFVNEYPKNAELKAHFDASMEQGNELIATHVPKAVAARLDTGAKLGHGDLPFFTNIYVPQSVRNTDFTPAIFEGFVARVKEQFVESVDPLTPQVLQAIKDVEKQPHSQPVNVGNFNKQANTFSILILLSSRVNGRVVASGSTLSYVMANKRMIYINIFKKITTDADIKSLIAFTKKWTTEIADANK